MPETATRMARCAYYSSCGTEVPSTRRLAFFESAESLAHDRCVCGYASAAHQAGVREQAHLRRTMGDGHEFTQRPEQPHDTFYCGCKGWD